MAVDQDVQQFRRAARQRLESAGILFEHRRFIDAVYLAGYAIECALKGLVLASVPARQRPALIALSFRGRRGHDFEYLKWLLAQNRRIPPASVAAALRAAGIWSTELRYNVGAGRAKDAAEVCRAATTVLDWVDRSLP